ncbi:MAG: hypothetical protein CLLPBCKN_000515 [Chroococcidiopsis cubana SAG 39.79]|nr:hypothetical protein [Chroococcidiopsis cubana SAG 39.79]
MRETLIVVPCYRSYRNERSHNTNLLFDYDKRDPPNPPYQGGLGGIFYSIVLVKWYKVLRISSLPNL